MNNSERTKCEIWTRVMGYHRPVSTFNIGKKAEHAERVFFKEPSKNDRQDQQVRCGFCSRCNFIVSINGVLQSNDEYAKQSNDDGQYNDARTR